MKHTKRTWHGLLTLLLPLTVSCAQGTAPEAPKTVQSTQVGANSAAAVTAGTLLSMQAPAFENCRSKEYYFHRNSSQVDGQGYPVGECQTGDSYKLRFAPAQCSRDGLYAKYKANNSVISNLDGIFKDPSFSGYVLDQCIYCVESDTEANRRVCYYQDPITKSMKKNLGVLMVFVKPSDDKNLKQVEIKSASFIDDPSVYSK